MAKGILVYFINKITGYKFAGFKGIDGDSEFSFWNAEDSRVDYLDIDADDYLFPIVRKIFKSEYTNKNLSSDDIQQQVHDECLTSYEKMRLEFVNEHMEQPTEVLMEQPEYPTPNYQREMNTIRELINDMDMTEEIGGRVPTMRA